jgi:hypothetical protein
MIFRLAPFAAHSQIRAGTVFAKGADRTHGHGRRVAYSGEAVCRQEVQRNLKLLVTGGAGFIGSALVRYLVNDTGEEVVNLDKLTYAGAGFNADSFPLASRIADEVPNPRMGAHLIAGRVAVAIAAVLAADSPE